MSYSYWLQQRIAVSRWLDSSVGAPATSLDHAPASFTPRVAGMPPAERRPARILVIITPHSPV